MVEPTQKPGKKKSCKIILPDGTSPPDKCEKTDQLPSPDDPPPTLDDSVAHKAAMLAVKEYINGKQKEMPEVLQEKENEVKKL